MRVGFRLFSPTGTTILAKITTMDNAKHLCDVLRDLVNSDERCGDGTGPHGRR